jgi:hypothetical protein
MLTAGWRCCEGGQGALLIQTWRHTRYYQSAVSPGIKAQVENGQLQMWYFVSISYEDMLGKPHQTVRRFRYEPRDDKFSMPTGDVYTVTT